MDDFLYDTRRMTTTVDFECEMEFDSEDYEVSPVKIEVRGPVRAETWMERGQERIEYVFENNQCAIFYDGYEATRQDPVREIIIDFLNESEAFALHVAERAGIDRQREALARKYRPHVGDHRDRADKHF